MTCAFDRGARRPRPASAPLRRLHRLYRHLALWVLQSWLAMFFIAAAYAKLTQPQDLLALLMVWPNGASLTTVRAIGGAELALGAAMVSPLISWRRFGPLMIASAIILACEAGFMALYHLANAHFGLAVTCGLLAAMAVVTAWGRWRENPGEAEASC
ncbi:hypothetical protein LTR94_024784 [Friedmanniomyces endolithicus]|nr:hypothetical protein LTR94_024784 [Friedmanniomyces endolithicus]